MVRAVKFFALMLAVFVVYALAEENKKETANEEDSTPKPIEVLSAYVKTTQFNDFPEAVINRAKYLILDNIGCALGGTQTEIGKKYLKVAANWKGIPESTVIGIGTRVSCMNAAYVNAQLANVLDFDDTYDFYLPGHPGNALVQTAIALGESIDASGEELLTAVILGYEVSLRIGRALGSIKWQMPMFLDSMTRGTITVASRLLKLEKKEICNALHHAIEIPLPVKRYRFDIPAGMNVPETKSNFGLYGIRGILAARLAQQRVTPGIGMLDGDIKQWYLTGGNIEGFDILTRGLGKFIE